jgi:hypothetical protein
MSLRRVVGDVGDEISWWKKKQFWVNAIAMVAIVYQYVMNGEVLAPEVQAAIIVIVNMIVALASGSNLVD